MPDHLHLFCAPRDLNFTLQQWVTYWKRKFSCLHLPDTSEWQRNFWDTRLRRGENYSQKWNYVRENPVRKELVTNPVNWPFQGRIMSCLGLQIELAGNGIWPFRVKS